MPKWPKRKSFWVLLRREPVAMETQSGRREAFAPATVSHDRNPDVLYPFFI
jgi:hypothetical protein